MCCMPTCINIVLGIQSACSEMWWCFTLVYLFLCQEGVGGKRNEVAVNSDLGDHSLQFPLPLTSWLVFADQWSSDVWVQSWFDDWRWRWGRCRWCVHDERRRWGKHCFSIFSFLWFKIWKDCWLQCFNSETGHRFESAQVLSHTQTENWFGYVVHWMKNISMRNPYPAWCFVRKCCLTWTKYELVPGEESRGEECKEQQRKVSVEEVKATKKKRISDICLLHWKWCVFVNRMRVKVGQLKKSHWTSWWSKPHRWTALALRLQQRGGKLPVSLFCVVSLVCYWQQWWQ